MYISVSSNLETQGLFLKQQKRTQNSMLATSSQEEAITVVLLSGHVVDGQNSL